MQPLLLSQINKLKLWGKASSCFLNRLRVLVSSLPFSALSLAGQAGSRAHQLHVGPVYC